MMGLDFTHCEAHWAYSGFHKFRKRLAECIGMNLGNMEGFDGIIPFECYDDDIIPLLNHSDCGGDLSPDVCQTVATRLRQLVSDWPDDDRDKINALKLAEGMELAHKRNEPLRFI